MYLQENTAGDLLTRLQVSSNEQFGTRVEYSSTPALRPDKPQLLVMLSTTCWFLAVAVGYI